MIRRLINSKIAHFGRCTPCPYLLSLGQRKMCVSTIKSWTPSVPYIYLLLRAKILLICFILHLSGLWQTIYNFGTVAVC